MTGHEDRIRFLIESGLLEEFQLPGGIVIVNVDKSININGNATNNQMNTGNKVTQTATWGATEYSKFDELINAINSHDQLRKEDKDNAIETLNDLKTMKESGALRPTILQKMWEMLPQVVKTITVAGEVFTILHGV